jgi:mannose-1-phosphate guanylyltransferase
MQKANRQHFHTGNLRKGLRMRTFGHDTSRNSVLWGLVLAAGDGRRLQSYIQTLRGENLPKQYVNFVGRRSMLEHTIDRAKKLISPRRIVTIVSRQHLQFTTVRRQLIRQPPTNVIVQPENRETLPGILLPLMHLYKCCSESIVAVFPSDHFILEEDRFMDYVAQAALAVAHDPARLVLLAVEPQDPETEYGYVVPRANDGHLSIWGTRGAVRFVEKPNAAMARGLIESGALWNTMIMVFKVRTLLQLIQNLCPAMYLDFRRILPVLGSANETKVVNEIYRTLEPMNFSKVFLERLAAVSPELISVLPVLQVSWSDWGSPERLLRAQELLTASRVSTSSPSCKRHEYRALEANQPD